MQKNPKVTIIVKSRFHAFNLSYQLQQLSLLDRLVTSYPNFEVKKYGIKSNKLISLPIHEIDRLWRKLPYFIKNKFDPIHILHLIFESHTKHKIHKNSNIVVAWSSFAMGVIREANKKNILSIVEHGSTHPIFNSNILFEEHELMGIAPPKLNKELISRQIQCICQIGRAHV